MCMLACSCALLYIVVVVVECSKKIADACCSCGSGVVVVVCNRKIAFEKRRTFANFNALCLLFIF